MPSPRLIAGLDPAKVSALAGREARRFTLTRPKSARAMAKADQVYLDGVPLHWMKDWPMPHLPLVADAKGALITDIDGYQINDFCLGDTGSMFGHSPKPVAKALRAQARRAGRPEAASRARIARTEKGDATAEG